MVERCITCHVPDIAKVGPQKAAERLGPNHPSVITDSVFAKYGQETLICRPATAAASASASPSASAKATASPKPSASAAPSSSAAPATAAASPGPAASPAASPSA